MSLLGGIGSSESSQVTKINNNQNPLQGGGAGSYNIAIGGGDSAKGKSSGKGKGKNSTSGGGSTGNITNTVTIGTDEKTVADAFSFAGLVQTLNAQTTGYEDQTINALAGQITGNASTIDPATGAPETNAPSGIDWGKWVSLALIAGGVVSVLAYINTKGKSA